MGKKWRFWVHLILWSSKKLFCFWIKAEICFPNGHIRNVVSTLLIDVEDDSFVSTLSYVVQFNVEIYNVVSTILNVVDFNVDVHNVVSTLIWRYAMSRRPKNNLKTTLNRRWNVCWEYCNEVVELRQGISKRRRIQAKQHRECGCKRCRWRGRGQRTRHSLNRKTKLDKERTNWDQ